MVANERELVGLALGLGAADLGELAPAEAKRARDAAPVRRSVVAEAKRAIALGEDPLGEAFGRLRSPAERRPLGATYTPTAIVAAMVASVRSEPARVVDAGAGSGRFAVAAGRAFPRAEIVAVEVDPCASLLSRAHLVTAGLAARARVAFVDYRALHLPPATGATLFLGNPPYVRHHGIDARSKAWLTHEARALGLPASQLAGLHVHFFLATTLHARPGDSGVFVTSAEWLDVGYGSLVRRLLVGPLGLDSLLVVEPTALPFDDADTTAAIARFTVGSRSTSIRMRRVPDVAHLTPLDGGAAVSRASLETAARWSPLTRAARATSAAQAPSRSADVVELGELCRVHRGQVTGANAVWIAGEDGAELPPRLLFPSVTRARELFAAGPALVDGTHLRRVVDLPLDLDALSLSPAERRAVDRFLAQARARGAHRGFIASHRKAWWSVGLRTPAPILATYMARRPPAFVRNLVGARHLNIAHGLYPRTEMTPAALDALAAYLARAVTLAEGRTYAGGLTKFEPREMERLLVPRSVLQNTSARDLAEAGGGGRRRT